MLFEEVKDVDEFANIDEFLNLFGTSVKEVNSEVNFIMKTEVYWGKERGEQLKVVQFERDEDKISLYVEKDNNSTNDVALELIDFYIKHNEKLGKRGLAGAFRELQTDINNALNIGDD